MFILFPVLNHLILMFLVGSGNCCAECSANHELLPLGLYFPGSLKFVLSHSLKGGRTFLSSVRQKLGVFQSSNKALWNFIITTLKDRKERESGLCPRALGRIRNSITAVEQKWYFWLSEMFEGMTHRFLPWYFCGWLCENVTQMLRLSKKEAMTGSLRKKTESQFNS